jgi:hypothetical protein
MRAPATAKSERSYSVVAIVAALAACGDNLDPPPPDAPETGTLEIVGHSPLGARGMNSALAVVGDTVYVGSRIDNAPILIVDVADPAAPAVVGEIGAPEQALIGMSSRELRAVPDLDLLVVMNIWCSPDLHGCARAVPAENENFRIYDISNRRAPVLLSKYEYIPPMPSGDRGPHEFYLWRDPNAGSRVLLFVSTPSGPDGYEVVDLSDPMMPRQVVTWDAVVDGGLAGGGVPFGDNILHSVSATPDGRTAYFSHQLGGLVAVRQNDVIDGVDPPRLSLRTPPSSAFDWAPPGSGPHSAVPIPGRALLFVTEEVYPRPFSIGCPWGYARIVDISDPATPTLISEIRVAENDLAFCQTPGIQTANVAFTSHNATSTGNLVFVTWYSAGIQVIDIGDPTTPRVVVDFRPEGLPSVTTDDPALGENPLCMWSYPVIQNGLIYVTDIRNGLYILRYTGPYDGEVSSIRFAEGNSNL